MFSLPALGLIRFALAALVAAEGDEADIEEHPRRYVQGFSVVEREAVSW